MFFNYWTLLFKLWIFEVQVAVRIYKIHVLTIRMSMATKVSGW